jgi:hypothetical protein
MVITGFFSKASFEKTHEPSRISFCILMTNSSLIFSGTGCTMVHTLMKVWKCPIFLRVGPNRSIPWSIIHFPFPSHGDPHFPNFGIIWSHLSWIRMGTVELCPMCDIYGERWNCHRKMDLEKFFLVIVKCHKCHTKCHKMLHLWHFQWGKWKMDCGILQLGPTLSYLAWFSGETGLKHLSFFLLATHEPTKKGHELSNIGIASVPYTWKMQYWQLSPSLKSLNNAHRDI